MYIRYPETKCRNPYEIQVNTKEPHKMYIRYPETKRRNPYEIQVNTKTA